MDEDVRLVTADERRLKQILVNLLSNAVKFTPSGGEVELEVRGDRERREARFSVRDTGIGIDGADLEKLFQPFVQLDAGLARQHGGTGLGLSLAARLAEAHGGRVTAESERGRGSRFTLSIPWRPVGGDGVTNAAAATEGKRAMAAVETSPLRIATALVVEDSPVAAEQVVRYLTEIGIEPRVTTVASGLREGMQRERPDVVLLDILLPDTNGWETLRTLKAQPETRDVPVIVLSVVDEPSRGRSLGAAEQLVKPITREQLAAALHRVSANCSRAAVPGVVDEFELTGSSAPAHRRILIVEDNEANITTVFDFLAARGFTVDVARSGPEALGRVRATRPDLILMDVQMPGMDGLEVMRRLKADPEARAIPVIALTALAMADDRSRCLAAGADEYLAKPVGLKRLGQAIESLLERRDRRPGMGAKAASAGGPPSPPPAMV